MGLFKTVIILVCFSAPAVHLDFESSSEGRSFIAGYSSGELTWPITRHEAGSIPAPAIYGPDKNITLPNSLRLSCTVPERYFLGSNHRLSNFLISYHYIAEALLFYRYEDRAMQGCNSSACRSRKAGRGSVFFLDRLPCRLCSVTDAAGVPGRISGYRSNASKRKCNKKKAG